MNQHTDDKGGAVSFTNTPETIDLIKAKIENLRNRLLDSSRRNPLVNVPFRANSTNLVRIVDELPDDLAARLCTRAPMRIVALPAIDEPMPDEQTEVFQDAFTIARATDETYLAADAKLDPGDQDVDQKQFEIERALKDRLRADLGLPERQTAENPSLPAHARAHGISPEYTLPLPGDRHGDGRHDDADIQTLLLPERLSRLGRVLHERGRAFERETGVNVLHAVFGLIEWNEPGSARTPAVSPVLLIEIQMERRKTPEGLEFTIAGEGEIAINTTLAQTLSSQYGLELPPYGGGSIEAYLADVATLMPAGWHWKMRREALFGVFPSSRIAMYRDLDPEKRSIAENPVIATLLVSSGGGDLSYAEVYDTDAPESERRVPHLVMDADASQFSALVDVSKGNNLAIEGPPGSGKSQTIVNLIAAALLDGKKVLFVAEKLTALDVVRNRLDAIGLGEFVLPLQAGHGARNDIFESLEARLALPRSIGNASASHSAGHGELCRRRQEMQRHLDCLGSPIARTGLTVHDALGQSIATADALDGLPRDIRRLRVPNAQDLTPGARTEILADVATHVDRLRQGDHIPELWRSAGIAPLRAEDAEDIATDLEVVGRALHHLRERSLNSPCAAFLSPAVTSANEEYVLALIGEIVARAADTDTGLVRMFLDDTEREWAAALCIARDARDGSAAWLEANLSPSVEEPPIDPALEEAEDFAARHAGEINSQKHAADLAKARSVQDNRKEQAALAAALPAGWAKSTYLTLADLRLDIARLLDTPEEILIRRTVDPGRDTAAISRRLVRDHTILTEDLNRIRQALPAAGTQEVYGIEASAQIIERSGIFRMFSGAYKRARRLHSETLGGNARSDRATVAADLRGYARWAERRDAFTKDAQAQTVLGSLFKGMETDTALLTSLSVFHDTVSEIAAGDERLRYALEAGPLDPLRAFAGARIMSVLTADDLDRTIVHGAERIETFEAICEEARRHENLFPARTHDADEKIPAITVEMIRTAKERRRSFVEAETCIANSPVASLFAGDDAPSTPDVQRAIRLAHHLTQSDHPKAGLDLLASNAPGRVLVDAVSIFEERRATATQAETLAETLGLDVKGRALSWFAARAKDIAAAVAMPEGLVEQARLVRSRQTLEGHGFDLLAEWIETPEAAEVRDTMPQIASALLARSLMDHVEVVHARVLDAHDGTDLSRLRREIAAIDKELIVLSRSTVRDRLLESARPPRGNGVGRVSSYTEMSLVQHEIAKVRNRLGSRDLTARAGRALLEIKPCWMMSPLAVAQYLHEGMSFDLVVIDEASQMTPENAIGALMRATQAVIVGDTKQLPPTNFFQKILDDSDIDEDERSDSESILDMANASFRPVRQLSWHYRSRHPALIALSNKMIYESKLTIFPAARDNDPLLGVSLVEVDGVYKKGRNHVEARAIVAGAIAHMRDHPELSLGLATMNKDQTDLINDEFERERDCQPHVEAYIRRWAEKENGLEEFFVKNLETIQGDERDVIMISTLYGPDADTGKTYQRFGPVNSVHGHRRLNVLFSRSKRRIVTYTSMKPTDIQGEGKAYGVQMLRAWLEYSRSGQISDVRNARAETGSPFEDFVIAQIEAAGFEAVPQVGASGYRIDIGVRHPDWPYGYLLGVECDGAPFHSSRSSRDRDRLRQEILEGLGWRFHRIWSTDWFRDPRTQIERLRRALDTALKTAQDNEIREAAKRAETAERVARVVDILAAEMVVKSSPPAKKSGEKGSDVNSAQGDFLVAMEGRPEPEPEK